jgi:hypothetical protein
MTRIEGTPRQLQSTRRPDYGLKVHALEEVELAGVKVGTLGTVDGIYSSGSILVRYHDGEHGTVLYDRQAAYRGLKPFQWVKLASKPGREVATLFRWARW